MPAECSPPAMQFARLDGRAVVADFGGGVMTSDAGALLLGATDRAIGLVDRFAACFSDGRTPARTVHDVATLVGQRVFGIALGYEDLIDHDALRHDPVLGVVLGRLEARRTGCAPLAGKSTLNRLEHAPSGVHRYRRIGHDGGAIERLFVDLFLDAHAQAPEELILDLDATDDPLHGHQEGRFFHGYYDCHCYLPLYIFCGDHLLAAKLRRSNIDASAGAADEVARIVARIRERWPEVAIVLRADSGFAREELMAWCEANGVDYVFGLGRNQRLVERIDAALAGAERDACLSGETTRRFADFPWTTRKSWSRERRVVAKAEWMPGREPPLRRHLAAGKPDRGALPLRDALLRPRRHGEPHQGVPAQPLRRPHLGSHHACQPAPPLVRLHGLCPARRTETHRPCPHPPRQSHLRLDPSQAAEDRRPGPPQHTPHPHRHGLRLPLPERVRTRTRPVIRRRSASGPAKPIPETAQEQHRNSTGQTTRQAAGAETRLQPPRGRRPARPPSRRKKIRRQSPSRARV